jgi:hypothetical protein
MRISNAPDIRMSNSPASVSNFSAEFTVTPNGVGHPRKA